MTEKEQIAELEAEIETATGKRRDELRKEINQLRGTLGMPDYEDETSNESEPNPEGNTEEVKKAILPKLEQLAEEARKYKSAEEFVASPNFEYHLSSDPNLVGKTIESELVFTTKTPHTWSVQLQYERWGAITPDELYLVWVKNPSKDFSVYYGHETVSPPDEVKVIGKIGNINELFGDEPISISVVEAIKKQQLTDFYNQVKMLGMPDYEDETLKQRVDTLIRYHFGGFGARMYALAGYLSILKDPAFSEEEKESAKKKAPENFAWIKRKYNQIPYSELSKSPFYDDLKPLFEFNKLLSALEEELKKKSWDFDKIESILSKSGEFGKEYTKAVNKYYMELTGKDLGAATVETRALMEYRSKEQIQDQARWLKEQGIEPNSFEKAAMEYYELEIPEEEPPWRRLMDVIKELEKEYGLEVPLDDVIDMAKEEGIVKPEELIHELKVDGLLYSPIKGLIARVEREKPTLPEAEIVFDLKPHVERAKMYDTYERYLETLHLPDFFDPDIAVKVFGNEDALRVVNKIRNEFYYRIDVSPIKKWQDLLRSPNPITIEDNLFCIHFIVDTIFERIKHIVDFAKQRGFVYTKTEQTKTEHRGHICRKIKLSGYNTLKEFWEAAHEKKPEEKVPEVWEMTKGSFLLSKYAADMKPREARKYHQEQVEKAVKEGKPVPEEVLKDYPDLIEKTPEEEIPPEVNYPQLSQGASYFNDRTCGNWYQLP